MWCCMISLLTDVTMISVLYGLSRSHYFPSLQHILLSKILDTVILLGVCRVVVAIVAWHPTILLLSHCSILSWGTELLNSSVVWALFWLQTQFLTDWTPNKSLLPSTPNVSQGQWDIMRNYFHFWNIFFLALVDVEWKSKICKCRIHFPFPE